MVMSNISGIFLPVTRVKHHRDYMEMEPESTTKERYFFTVVVDEVCRKSMLQRSTREDSSQTQRSNRKRKQH
jgi:hypothetical protein